MRKIFSILAAAVIALSFASCEKTDPGMKFFNLKVKFLEGDTVSISINPADTSVYYGIIFDKARGIEEDGGLDTIIAKQIEDLQFMIENYHVGLEELAEYNYVYKGAEEDHGTLPANTTFTLAAYEVLMSADSVVSCGHVASKTFTTKKMEVVGTVDLGTLEDAELYDFSQYGAYILLTDGDTAAMILTVYDDKFKGSYSYYDIEPYNSAVWTESYGEHNLVDAKFTTTYKESDKTGKASGWVVGDNGIKYKFSFAFALYESSPAPARLGKKDFFKEEKSEGLQKQSLFPVKRHRK